MTYIDPTKAPLISPTFTTPNIGTATGSASLNVLKAGDTMSGALTITSTGAAQLAMVAPSGIYGANFKLDSSALSGGALYTIFSGGSGDAGGASSFGIYNNSGGILALSINPYGVLIPYPHATTGAPAYVKGGIYFDTTLNKLRVGGATAWETITSV